MSLMVYYVLVDSLDRMLTGCLEPALWPHTIAFFRSKSDAYAWLDYYPALKVNVRVMSCTLTLEEID